MVSEWSKMENTRHTLKKRNTPLTWGVILLAAYLFFPSLLFKYIWMDLEKVHVFNYGDPHLVQMDIERELHRDFRGTFTVDLFYKKGNHFICRGQPIAPFWYKKGNEIPTPTYLEWWIGGETEFEECIVRGFKNGEYYLQTCHTVVWTIYDIPFARRCVRSNYFTVGDAS